MTGLNFTPAGVQRQITAPMHGPIDWNQPLHSPAQTQAMTQSNQAAQQLPGMGRFNTAIGEDGVLHSRGRNPSPAAMANKTPAPTSFGFDRPPVHKDYQLPHGYPIVGQSLGSMGATAAGTRL
jgi:hypothetical protein